MTSSSDDDDDLPSLFNLVASPKIFNKHVGKSLNDLLEENIALTKRISLDKKAQDVIQAELQAFVSSNDHLYDENTNHNSPPTQNENIPASKEVQHLQYIQLQDVTFLSGIDVLSVQQFLLYSETDIGGLTRTLSSGCWRKTEGLTLLVLNLLKAISLHSDGTYINLYEKFIKKLSGSSQIKRISVSCKDVFVILFNYSVNVMTEEIFNMIPFVKTIPMAKSFTDPIPEKWIFNLKAVLNSLCSLLKCLMFKEDDLCNIVIYLLWLGVKVSESNLELQKCLTVAVCRFLHDSWPKCRSRIALTMTSLTLSMPEDDQWNYISDMTKFIPFTVNRGIELRKYICSLALKKLTDVSTMNLPLEYSELFSLSNLLSVLEYDIENDLQSIFLKFLDILINHLRLAPNEYEVLYMSLKSYENVISNKSGEISRMQAHLVKIYSRISLKLPRGIIGKVGFIENYMQHETDIQVDETIEKEVDFKQSGKTLIHGCRKFQTNSILTDIQALETEYKNTLADIQALVTENKNTVDYYSDQSSENFVVNKELNLEQKNSNCPYQYSPVSLDYHVDKYAKNEINSSIDSSSIKSKKDITDFSMQSCHDASMRMCVHESPFNTPDFNSFHLNNSIKADTSSSNIIKEEAMDKLLSDLDKNSNESFTSSIARYIPSEVEELPTEMYITETLLVPTIFVERKNAEKTSLNPSLVDSITKPGLDSSIDDLGSKLPQNPTAVAEERDMRNNSSIPLNPWIKLTIDSSINDMQIVKFKKTTYGLQDSIIKSGLDNSIDDLGSKLPQNPTAVAEERDVINNSSISLNPSIKLIRDSSINDMQIEKSKKTTLGLQDSITKPGPDCSINDLPSKLPQNSTETFLKSFSIKTSLVPTAVAEEIDVRNNSSISLNPSIKLTIDSSINDLQIEKTKETTHGPQDSITKPILDSSIDDLGSKLPKHPTAVAEERDIRNNSSIPLNPSIKLTVDSSTNDMQIEKSKKTTHGLQDSMTIQSLDSSIDYLPSKLPQNSTGASCIKTSLVPTAVAEERDVRNNWSISSKPSIIKLTIDSSINDLQIEKSKETTHSPQDSITKQSLDSSIDYLGSNPFNTPDFNSFQPNNSVKVDTSSSNIIKDEAIDKLLCDLDKNSNESFTSSVARYISSEVEELPTKMCISGTLLIPTIFAERRNAEKKSFLPFNPSLMDSITKPGLDSSIDDLGSKLPQNPTAVAEERDIRNNSSISLNPSIKLTIDSSINDLQIEKSKETTHGPQDSITKPSLDSSIDDLGSKLPQNPTGTILYSSSLKTSHVPTAVAEERDVRNNSVMSLNSVKKLSIDSFINDLQREHKETTHSPQVVYLNNQKDNYSVSLLRNHPSPGDKSEIKVGPDVETEINIREPSVNPTILDIQKFEKTTKENAIYSLSSNLPVFTTGICEKPASYISEPQNDSDDDIVCLDMITDSHQRQNETPIHRVSVIKNNNAIDKCDETSRNNTELGPQSDIDDDIIFVDVVENTKNQTPQTSTKRQPRLPDIVVSHKPPKLGNDSSNMLEKNTPTNSKIKQIKKETNSDSQIRSLFNFGGTSCTTKQKPPKRPVQSKQAQCPIPVKRKKHITHTSTFPVIHKISRPSPLNSKADDDIEILESIQNDDCCIVHEGSEPELIVLD